MKIPFAVPHVFTRQSSDEESTICRKLVDGCIKRIARDSTTIRKPPTAVVGQGSVMFDLPHAFHGRSNARDNAIALQSLLCCLSAINIAFLLRRPNTVTLYNSGVYYDRTVVWDSIPALYMRGYGDCKTLTAARIAELRIRGIKTNPVFRFDPKPEQTNYHILVQTPETFNPVGFEDPSKILGMGRNENAYF